MPKTRPPFPPEFRREGVAMVPAGQPVWEVAEALGGQPAVAVSMGQAGGAEPA